MSLEPTDHYIVFYQNGEIKQVLNIDKDNRLDKVIVIKRTFVKKSSGKGEFSYHTSQVLDGDLKEQSSKSFEIGKVKCKIVREQYWAKVKEHSSSSFMFMDFEITDLLEKKELKRFEFKEELQSFNALRNYLDLVNRVGTIQGANEIEKLQNKIKDLEKKIMLLKR